MLAVRDEAADSEGDLAEGVRASVGSDVPIGIHIDLHSHLTERMLANSDAIVIYVEAQRPNMRSVCAIMIGRTDDWLEVVTTTQDIITAPD